MKGSGWSSSLRSDSETSLQRGKSRQYDTSPSSSTRSSPHGKKRTTGSKLQRTAVSNSRRRADDETSSNASDNPSVTSSASNIMYSSNVYNPLSPSAFSASSSELHARGTSSTDRGHNFKVVIRVRPPLPRELHGNHPFQNVIAVDKAGQEITISEQLGNSSKDGEAADGGYSSHTFSFDHVYDQQCDQQAVYENTAQAVVESSLQGYNATIFAYGQTGTGKTYTMEGFTSGDDGGVEKRGIIPRAIEQIFFHIRSHVSPRTRFLVRASYLQIYNESISDLLKPERNHLTIREDKRRGVFVEGLSEWVVRSPEEIYGLMERGGSMRATGSTKMNEISSRSHAVFIIIAEQSQTMYVDDHGNDIPPEDFSKLVQEYQSRAGRGNSKQGLPSKLESMVRQSFKVGKLNLVDLAGSERVRLSGATGQRLEESKKINQSLSALGNVISALTDARGRQHIPYRDSKLTRILEDSLGGNCKTTMMAMVSPAHEAMVESLSTLKFANRAKHVKNEAKVNEDLDQKSLLRKYERELKRLRAELEEKYRNVVDKRRLLELEEQKRRAEEDKMAAIRALEERSRAFMKEKAEKKKLEERISKLTSQMLMTNQRKGHFGNSGQESSEFDLEEALRDQQAKIKKEYEGRLADLEKERETIEQEKAQVDRYKQLLLKQRDIMIALTQRLNERDEQITGLQDELDASDRKQKELEEKLDEKTAHLIHLQRVTMEHSANSPAKPSADLMNALGDWSSCTNKPSSGETNAPEQLEKLEKEKKSLQFLLDQKLERLVQVELQARGKTGDSSASVVGTNGSTYLQEQIVKMGKQLDLLESENRGLRETNEQRMFEKESGASMHLQQRCETLVKERRAMQTIMEQKIKALVTAVCDASEATLQSAGGTLSLGEPAQWLTREISALQRLVNASIVALRNAEAADAKQVKLSNNREVDPVVKSDVTPAQVKPIGLTPDTNSLSRSSSVSNISVDEMIQQRRSQMVKERQERQS